MKRFSSSLLNRLILYVSGGLLGFAILSGAVVFHLAYQHALSEAASLERQLVYTVQAQAEVAVFAVNTKIAEQLIDGLRENPRIRAVRIIGEAGKPLNLGAGFSGVIDASATTSYPLFSPVEEKERIGYLVVARNEALIRAEATLSAMRQTALLLIQIVATALLILWAFRHTVGKPIALLARDMASVTPGEGKRLTVAPSHREDEIGSLTESANALLDSAERALEEVRALATTDVLTGLSNRRAFLEQMRLELSRLQRNESTPASGLMFDPDHFKDINDHYGHAAGDAVLKEFGLLLQGQLRKIDTAGRMGGEEFPVVLTNTDSGPATSIAQSKCPRLSAAAHPQ